MFGHIERVGHQGFNLAYDPHFPNPKEPQPELEDLGAALQNKPLETLDQPPHSTLFTQSPQEPDLPRRLHPRMPTRQQPPKSYLIYPGDGVHIRISFPEDCPDEWDVEKWYEDGRHTGKVNEFNMIRFLNSCLYRPCTNCQENIGKSCTCGYRDID